LTCLNHLNLFSSIWFCTSSILYVYF
jgi:hypothetical protein